MDKYRPEVLDFQRSAHMGYIIFDTETTGLNPGSDRVIQMSAKKYVGNSAAIEELNFYIDSVDEVPEAASAVNGITTEQIKAEGISETEAVEKIAAFFAGNEYAVAYNTPFDVKMLNAMFQRERRTDAPLGNKFLDVLMMSKDKLAKPHKLDVVVPRLGLDNGLSFHNSLDDVEGTFRLLWRLIPLYKTEEKKTEISFVVTGVNRWTRQVGDTIIDRIYVNTAPRHSVYLDVSAGFDWFTDDNVPIPELEKMVLDFAGVKSKPELLKKLS